MKIDKIHFMNNKHKASNQTELLEEIEVKESILLQNEIVIFNDDVNTFEHVIDCLINYCGHDSLQAEQCALIIHFKGKCSVKKGNLKVLKPICEALLEQGLNAQIN